MKTLKPTFDMDNGMIGNIGMECWASRKTLSPTYRAELYAQARKLACYIIIYSFLLIVVSSCASSSEYVKEMMPDEVARIIPQSTELCPKIAGEYELVGRVFPETPGFIGTLDNVLRAGYPNVTYQPEAR